MRGMYTFPINSISKDKDLDVSKLKVFVDNNFKIDEKGEKFSTWVKNIVGHVSSNFSFSHSDIKNTYKADMKKHELLWVMANSLPSDKNSDLSNFKAFAGNK